MLQLKRKKEPPERMLKHTYQNELRAIGRYCDDRGLRGIGIYEVDNGLILRGFANPNDPHSLEAIEVPKDDIQSLMLRNFTAKSYGGVATRSPLCPTGYEDFLRALGYELELNKVRAVALQELVDRFAVTYMQLQSTSDDGYIWETRSVMLPPDDIQKLLDEAFGRRGLSAE